MLSPAKENIFSISQLNQSVASLLEQNFRWIWVEGELSNLAQPASGHLYFSLKDSHAQIRCAMFKGSNRKLGFQPGNGQQVLVRAKVSLYQPRGDYQLIIDRMEDAGAGALRRQFEQLKRKLAAEGLFDENSKQSLPQLPSCIGIITSASGAALHDVLSVIKRRFPAIAVSLLPVPVQGKEAAPAICRALAQLARQNTCDVILLVRGGGSLEDLWPFNEETLARAIFDCPIPLVSGIGHEVDTTIADFVADVRAATPTAAAETVTPDQYGWFQRFDNHQQRLQQLLLEKIQRSREKIGWLDKRLLQQHPNRIIRHARENCIDLQSRLKRSGYYRMAENQARLRQLQTRLFANHPGNLVRQKQQTLLFHTQQIRHAIQNILQQKRNHLRYCAHTLQAVSPLKTLERGYSITLDENHQTITSTSQLKPGSLITTRLRRGNLLSRVEKVVP